MRKRLLDGRDWRESSAFDRDFNFTIINGLIGPEAKQPSVRKLEFC
ncbi:MAG: hypothetical protein AAGH89_07910 [Verrucomicrobiota bacterium]